MIYDKRVAANVIGCLMQNPSILVDTDKYMLEKNDFTTQLHVIVFSTIYNLFHQGAYNLSIDDIHIYLKKYPALYDTFNKQEGSDFIVNVENTADLANFDVYYDRLKKLSLLREIKSQGFSIDEWYAEGSYDIAKRQELEQKLERTNIRDIILSYQGKLSTVESKFSNKKSFHYTLAHDGIEDLIKELQEVPEIGFPLQGKFLTTISRGARKKKLYLMSGATGAGKSRLAVGNACYMAYPIRWCDTKGDWVNEGSNRKVLFITTELSADEIQTIIAANISGINEENILNGKYSKAQKERIEKAFVIMKEYKDNFHLYHMSDPNVTQLNSNVRRLVINHQIEGVFFDYIHTSPALLNEFSGSRIRTDEALGLLSTALKNLANELNVFVWSGTQLNAQARDSDFMGIHCIRGSKAIADKTDFMCAIAKADDEKLKTISTLLKAGYPRPNMYLDVFKNRRGKYTQVRIWMQADLGTARVKDLFITDEYGDELPIDLLYTIDEDAQCNVKEVLSKTSEEEAKDKPKQIQITL